MPCAEEVYLVIGDLVVFRVTLQVFLGQMGILYVYPLNLERTRDDRNVLEVMTSIAGLARHHSPISGRSAVRV